MRGIYISLAVMFFTISIGIVNEVDSAHFVETGRPIYGMTTNKSIDYNDFGYSESSLESALEPKEQPQGLVDSIWSGLTYVVRLGSFIKGVLYNATVGLPQFLQDFGMRDEAGNSRYTIVPAYIANIVAVLIWLNHMFVILQLMSGRNLRDGI